MERASKKQNKKRRIEFPTQVTSSISFWTDQQLMKHVINWEDLYLSSKVSHLIF